MSLKSINPATEELIKTYEATTPEESDQILKKAHDAYLKWKRTSFEDRAKVLKTVARILREDRASHAALMTQEMGKPIKQAESEIEKCAWACEYYADQAAEFLKDELVKTDASKSYVHFNPMGIILAVMPWNFPYWQVFRCLAPSLMAGNTVVLKHAGNVSGCALAMKEIFKKAQAPEGLFSVLLLSAKNVDHLIEDPRISAVTLTGSTPAGQAVASKAGKCLKKTVLELGGSDPYVILKDADLDKTVEMCVTSRMVNTGQSCIAAKRFIVVKEIRPEFEKRFVEKMKAYKSGDPTKEETNVGPLARMDLRDSLHDQVSRSVKQGAHVLLGGEVPQGKGAFYPPTILTNVKKGSAAYHEETFGPVASIIEAKDEKEAVQIANDSPFGLGAAIFTKNLKQGELIAADEIEAGSCFVNACVKSDPRLPFGGVKQSGYGRELGVYGIKEFVNIKTIYIE